MSERDFREIARIQSIDDFVTDLRLFCLSEGLTEKDTNLVIATAFEDLKRRRGWASKVRKKET